MPERPDGLELHRQGLCDWFNANGHNAYIKSWHRTLVVDDIEIWHEVKCQWVSWWVEQRTDHSWDQSWHFRMACEFMLDDHQWEKQAKQISTLFKFDDEFWKLQDKYVDFARSTRSTR